MRQIKIYDDQFPHAFTMANGGLNIKAKNFEWSRTLQGSKFAFITESWFNRLHLVNEPFKIGLLIEPRGFVPHWYEWIKRNYHRFDYVLTHDLSLLHVSNKFSFYPYGGCWLYENQKGLFNKTKNISIIASHKNDLEGHKLRHEVIRRLGNKVDVYGNGYNKVESVLEAYKDYRFTIAIENDRYDYWLTEKLINPLLCGCVPIYWGTPTIYNGFFQDIIQFKTVDDVENIVNNLDFEKEYNLRNNSIVDNFIKAHEYEITEDWIWNNFLIQIKSLLE